MSFTLRYDGMKFETPENKPTESKEDKKKEPAAGPEKVKKFGYTFSNIGALTIRYQLGQRHRAALLQQIALENYAQRPVQQPAAGGDEQNIFGPNMQSSDTAKQTADLLKYSHATIGRGRVVNERQQALKEKNKPAGTAGELLIWDMMHHVVMLAGMTFAGQLGSQGFVYVAAPEDDDPEKHAKITEALQKGDFEVKDGNVHVLGVVLPRIAPENVKLEFDAKKETTFQDNGFVISSTDPKVTLARGPVGWLMHSEQKKILPQDLTEDCLRIMKVGTARFHSLSQADKDLLQGGRMAANKETTITQNALFNALYAISIDLNRDFNFDPEKLLGDRMEEASEKLTKHFANPNHLDDFLTGILLTEMTQALHVSQETSNRKYEINYKIPFAFTLNNAKAFAYAFNIQDSKHHPVLIPDAPGQNPLSKDPKLIDVAVNGKLALPALTSGKHAGAILSTAILVTEQLFMEQLLRDALNNDTVEELLKKIMGKSREVPRIAKELKNMAAGYERDERGPIMGLQYAYCEPMIQLIRKELGFETLIEVAEALENSGKSTVETLKTFESVVDESVIEPLTGMPVRDNLMPQIEGALKKLYLLGEMLQSNPNTDASSEMSRGINAGLIPLILKMTPELGKRLKLHLEVQGEYQVPDYQAKAKQAWGMDFLQSIFNRKI